MGRHGVPDGEVPPVPDEAPPVGRRRAPEPEPPAADPWPDDDELTTLGRRTRAERRRDGLLPRGEDPMSGRGPGQPGTEPPPGGRPPAQAGPRTYVTGIPAAAPAPRPDVPRHDVPRPDVPRPDVPRPDVPRRDTAPPASRGPVTPPPPPPGRGPGAPPPSRGPGTPPPAEPATRAQPPPPPTRGLPTPVPPPVEAPGRAGPGTTVDPLPGSRPPATRAPETSSLPAWSTTLGPPTPAPTSSPTPAPTPAPWTGPERRTADRPEAVPPTGDRRGARTQSLPERPPLAGSARPGTGPAASTPAAPAPAAPAPAAPTRMPERATAPGTGETGVIGGRAASRAERQAVDVVRRREERRQGITPIPPLPDEGRRGSRGLVIALVSFVVVALVLLGVWSFQAPDTQESASTAPAATSTGTPTTTAPAPAPSAPVTTPAGPTGPVFAPVTVLNATTVNGLAGDIGTVLAAGGWEIRQEGSYAEQDVAVTTVFYTAGDTTQEQAAATLQAQFPDVVGGPSERFFDVDGVPDPGIVVIATGSWQP